MSLTRRFCFRFLDDVADGWLAWLQPSRINNKYYVSLETRSPLSFIRKS